MTTTTEQLRECPFCGSSDLYHSTKLERITCTNSCGASAPFDLWNSAPRKSEVERLEKENEELQLEAARWRSIAINAGEP